MDCPDNIRYNASVMTKNIRSIISESMCSDTFNISPSYQREFVWTTEKSSAFIQSCMIGIVPHPILFNSDSSTGITTCIDGRQRITSLQKFHNNEIPVDYNGETLYFTKIPDDKKDNKDVRVMKTEEKTWFLNRNISVIQYDNLTYQEQIDIFKRIQLGVALSPGEIIPSVFKDENMAAIFNKFCNENEKLVNKYVKFKTRKGHVSVMAILINILNSDKWIVPKNFDNFLNSFKTKKEFSDMLTKSLLKMKILFSQYLLGSHHINATKDFVNVFFYTMIMCIDRFYSLKDLTQTDCDRIVRILLDTKDEFVSHKNSKKIGNNLDTVEYIKNIFLQKKTQYESGCVVVLKKNAGPKQKSI